MRPLMVSTSTFDALESTIVSVGMSRSLGYIEKVGKHLTELNTTLCLTNCTC